jgi:uncharacterized protein (TIGR00369 family)
VPIEGHPPDCFVCARLGVEPRVEDHAVIAELELGENVMGPPPSTHGGAIAALFDELLGLAVHSHAPGAMTARIEVDFRHPWTVGEPALMRCEARRLADRKFVASGELVSADGALLAEARGLWIVPKAEG